jgi:hypothetical protein
MADDQARGGWPPGTGPAQHERLRRLHEWGPGQEARPPLVAVCFLLAASSPAEWETAARAHDAQAAQLRGPLPAAFADTYHDLAPLWVAVGARAFGDGAAVAQLLQLVQPELAARVHGRLTGAGVSPDVLIWPPVIG